MTEDAILAYLTQTFPAVQILTSDGNHFIYHAPTGQIPEKGFPFATLVTGDLYDQASNLTRPGVFRLNIGLSKATFLALFGQSVPRPHQLGIDIIESGYDYTTLDQLMPHPIYGNMYWVCILNPSDETWGTVEELLREAYEMSEGNEK